MPPGDSMDKGKGYVDMIGCTVVVSVSASCSRCYMLWDTWDMNNFYFLFLLFYFIFLFILNDEEARDIAVT